MGSLRRVELADWERGYVTLPDDEHNFTNVTVPFSAPTAEVHLDADDREELRGSFGRAFSVYLDAVAGRWVRLTHVDDDSAGVDTQPSDVTVGQRFNSRLLRAAMDALTGGPLAIVWRRAMGALTLHALEAPAGRRDAMVMPMRSCTPLGYAPEEAKRRAVCLCRDCAAGRRWGW